MPSNNDLKYENSRTFRQYLRELCLRGMPRSMYKYPKAFDKVLQMAQHWLSYFIIVDIINESMYNMRFNGGCFGGRLWQT